MLTDLIGGIRHTRIPLTIGGLLTMVAWVGFGDAIANQPRPGPEAASGRFLMAMEALGTGGVTALALLGSSFLGTAVWRVFGRRLTKAAESRLVPIEEGPPRRFLRPYHGYYEGAYKRTPSIAEQHRDLQSLSGHLSDVWPANAEEHMDRIRRLRGELEYRVVLWWLLILAAALFLISCQPIFAAVMAIGAALAWLDARSTARYAEKVVSLTAVLYEQAERRCARSERKEVRDATLLFSPGFPNELVNYDAMPKSLQNLLADVYIHLRGAMRRPDDYTAQDLREVWQIIEELSRRSPHESYGGSEVYSDSTEDLTTVLSLLPSIE